MRGWTLVLAGLLITVGMGLSSQFDSQDADVAHSLAVAQSAVRKAGQLERELAASRAETAEIRRIAQANADAVGVLSDQLRREGREPDATVTVVPPPTPSTTSPAPPPPASDCEPSLRNLFCL